MHRILAEAAPSDLPAMFRKVTAIAGLEAWRHREEGLRSLQESNPLWRPFIRRRYSLELTFGDVCRHIRNTGRIPWSPHSELTRLYSFVASLDRVFDVLSPLGKKKLAGAVRSGLEKEYGLGPLAFEMKLVAHLSAQGFAIQFHDLESDGGFDFLATAGATQIEIECKHVSGDVGRQIHQADLVAFGGVINSVLGRTVEGGNVGKLVRVTIPGRLTRNIHKQQELCAQIEAVLSGVVNEGLDASIEEFPIEESPFALSNTEPSMAQIRSYLGERHGLPSHNVLARWQPGKSAVLISLSSKKPDKVLRGILRALKNDARRQFSTKLPAVLCVHFSEVTESQLIELSEIEASGQRTGLQLVASQILNRRPHLHTVALMTDGQVTTDGRSTRESGPSYVFRNPNHPSAGIPELENIFFP